MAIYQLGSDVPRIAATAWVADSAEVIGRVDLADNASVWFGSVLRGDNEWMQIGERANVQDGCVLHSDPGFPLTLGKGATIGHKVMLHGCTIGESALIGVGAIVLNGARIGRGCLVGAGAVVTEGAVFADNMLILGTPAKAVRELTPEQVERIQMSSAHYVDNAERYRSGLKKIR